MMKGIFCIAFLSGLFALCHASIQSVGVRGTLICGDKPLNNTRIKLWDEDSGIDPDDELASVLTDAKGNFQLSGYTDEMSYIDPVMKIYHDCDDGITPCQRKLKFNIPDQYINSGNTVTKWFNAGIMNMELVFPTEERDCDFGY